MGLVVIVILISLALIFFIQFALLKEPSESRATYTRGELASNTINALLRTETPCQGRDFTQLIEDCMDGVQSYNCFGRDICNYTEEKIELILNQTLNKWAKNYQFKVYRGQEAKINITQGQCLRERDSQTNPLTGKMGRIWVRLDVCEK